MIYLSRIVGKEFPVNKGDTVVCVTDHFNEFTFGKQYTLYSDISDCINSEKLLPIISDLGNQSLPKYTSSAVYYFLPMNVILADAHLTGQIQREMKINKILENS